MNDSEKLRRYRPRRYFSAREIAAARQAWAETPKQRRVSRASVRRMLEAKNDSKALARGTDLFEQIAQRKRRQVIVDARRAALLTAPAFSNAGGPQLYPSDSMFAALALRLVLDCTFAGLNAHLRRQWPERFELFGALRRTPCPDTYRNFARGLSPETLQLFVDNLKSINPGLALIVEFRAIQENALN